MKIAIVTPTLPPYAGGIGNVAAWNARELVKLGHAVTIFTPSYGPVVEEITDVPVVRVKPLFRYGNAAYVPRLGKLLRGYDIIHLHYPFFGGAEVVLRHAKRLRRGGAKIILHYHMDVVGSGWLAKFFALHRKFILPKILRMPDKLIVTSLDYARSSASIASMVEHEPNRIVEVPNGVDITHFRRSESGEHAELRTQLGIDLNERVVLFVGGLDRAHYFKGVSYLLEAMSDLRQASYRWKLVIVGSGDLQSQYESLASQLGIGHLVVFTGYVPYAQLPALYALATVAVLPSVDSSEAFGMVLVEAMACARPVIASDLPGVRSVVKESGAGLVVEPKNTQALEQAIHQLCSDEALALAYGQSGMVRARLRYDWKVIAQTLDQLYHSLR